MIDILIPTYNRSQELSKNLKLLKAEIDKYQLYNHIKIIISNNASQDDTASVVQSFKTENKSIKLAYFIQEENIGLEKNAVAVLSKATAEYIMFLGDDDFLAEGYLDYCLKMIREETSLGYIIPGISSLERNGKITKSRLEPFTTKNIEKGYLGLLEYSHLGHQMSGILNKRLDLLEDYLAIENHRNIYLFIYFLSNRMYRYNGIYAPMYKINISVDNTKEWSYNSIGLLDEVFKSYYPFIHPLGDKKVANLMTRFILMHSYRVALSKNPIYNYKAITASVKSIKTFNFKLLILLFKEYFAHLIK